MDEEDYRAIIAALAAELRAIGAEDVADEAHYIGVNSETGEPILILPQERLVAMLFAFERFLAVRDGEIGRKAIARLQQNVEGEGPMAAVLVTTEETVSDRAEIDLLDMPDLGQLRSRVRILAEQIGSRDIEPPPFLRA
jgi:hypothetical protein